MLLLSKFIITLSAFTRLASLNVTWLVQQLNYVTDSLMIVTDRWAGRSNRGKISVHVEFGTQLDVQKYCCEDLVADSYLYSLSAVVMHHGRGFGSGHYTSFCWNDEAGMWLSASVS